MLIINSLLQINGALFIISKRKKSKTSNKDLIRGEILDCLKTGPKHYKELAQEVWLKIEKEKSGLTERSFKSVILERRLKGLIEEKYVNRTGITRKNVVFELSTKGIEENAMLPFAKMNGKKPQKAYKILLPEILKSINTLDDVTPAGEAPVDVVFYLDSKNKKKIEAVSGILASDLFLRDTAYKFVDSCQKAILNSSEDVYHWHGYKNGPFQIRKRVENLKTSLNFDAILSLHFNGKSFVEKYDWKKDIVKIEKLEKIEYETWPLFVSGASKMGTARDSWIDFCISENLNKVYFKQLAGLKTFNPVVAKDKTSLINQYAEHIVSNQEINQEMGKILHEGPMPPTVEDVKKHLEEMIDDGTLDFTVETTVTFKVNTEKIGRRVLEATKTVFLETGYTLP